LLIFFENDKTNGYDDFIAKGNTSNKLVWVYSAGDIGISLNADVCTFRLSGFHNKLNGETFILPLYVDPLSILKKKNLTYPQYFLEFGLRPCRLTIKNG
jgi:hypothetical protein